LEELCEQDEKIKELKNTNRAYKGANTKHKATIKELEEYIKGSKEVLSDYLEVYDTKQEQADTIQKLNSSLDESYIAINAVGNESNKKKRLEQLDKYMTK
tara:strand:- start:265 stop:564 length:300 start_codon:yes stop_codon:yes gene_type:complete